MDYAHDASERTDVDPRSRTAVARAQVITQNYVCFVYLREPLFKVLKETMPPQSVTNCCAEFLTENPVRAFRNALAHANWRYLSDPSGLEFWAWTGRGRAKVTTRFEVRQDELGFWQALARAVAYVAYTEITEYNQ